MSFCFNPMIAAKIAVDNPITMITFSVIGARLYRMLERAIMYIPAVTMVAAWISAETGVGPAIASGSQVNNGICALLPTAPIRSKSVITVIIGVPICMVEA